MERLGLREFLNQLENGGKLNRETNWSVQHYLDLNNRTLSRIFLILAGLYGLAFVFLGVATFFAGDWFSYAKAVKVILGSIPVSAGIFVMILAHQKHKESAIWMEVSTVFMTLMLGASIFLLTFAFDIHSDPRGLLKVWLLLIIPLLYVGRSSGIVLLYLSLNLVHLQPDFYLWKVHDDGFMSNSAYYWLFFLAYIPHFMLFLNRSEKRQRFRMIIEGWFGGAALVLGSALAIKAGHWFWFPAILLGMYVIGKRYYGENASFLSRPLQNFALYFTPFLLLLLSNKFVFGTLVSMIKMGRMSDWSVEQMVHFGLGLVAFVFITYYLLKNRAANPDWNKLLVYFPFVMIFIILLIHLEVYDIVDLSWWTFFIINLYVFVFAFHALFQGSNNGNIVYMIFGLLVMVQLMASIYQNMDRADWVKALFFIGAGGLFYIIVLLFRDDLRTD